MSPPAASPDSATQLDPTYLHARREALLIVGVWALCLLWAVPYCYLNGYLRPGEEFDPAAFDTVLGIPRWTFFGVLLPWLLADVFTTWFCFAYMQDDDLGEAPEDADPRSASGTQEDQH